MKISLLILSLISEAIAFSFIGFDIWTDYIWYTFGSFHIVSSALAAIAMMNSLDHVEINTKRLTFLFFFSNCFFVPILGCFGLLWSVVHSLNHPKEHVIRAWVSNKRESLPSNPRDMLYSKFGTGALRDILINSPSVDRRVDAITSVSRLPRALRISFYKLALRDPADDVRLLAYSQLDPLEQEITDNIKDLIEFYDSNPNADTAYDIAQQFWELCYLGISEGVLFDHYISKSNEWCQKAISHEDRASFELLQGRIYLNMHETEKAKEALLKAQKSNMLSGQILPYLAECAFNAHEYSKVKEIVKSFSNTKGSKISHIKEYWSDEL